MAERVLTWDYREQPPMGKIAAAVLQLSGGRVHIEFPDTYSDQYAIVLADHELTLEQANAAWKAVADA